MPKVKKSRRKKRIESVKPANRPKVLKQWSNDSMLGAMQAVQTGEMGVNRAALEYGVPRTTLKDRISGRVLHGCKAGPKPYLTFEEEKELVDFLIKCSKMGYGKTRGEVLKIVEATVLKKGVQIYGTVSNGWWIRFRERWPQLSLRKGDSFPLVRDKVTCRDVFVSYFNLLKQALETSNLMDSPGQLYNCDESGMPLEHKLPKTIAVRGSKKVRQVTSGNKTQITVLGCVNAVGQSIPPMVIFAGKRFNHELSKGEIPGTLYGMSESGWMDQELFSSWFSNHFLKHAVASRPLLLLLDGHSSHYTLDLVQSASDNGVIIMCLPPHTTADSQPLDTSCFGPLKVFWSGICRQYMFDNPGRVVTKFLFSKLFSEAWGKGMTISNIVSGFRRTGVYPFNPNAILDRLPPESSSLPESSSSPAPESSSPAPESSSSPAPESSSPAPENSFSPATHELYRLPATHELYRLRYENGYDIYTNDYVVWLQKFHPEAVPVNTHSSVQQEIGGCTCNNYNIIVHVYVLLLN